MSIWAKRRCSCLNVWYLDVDPVELVEASPGAAGRQPLEELAHGDVVQAVGTVEHHALHRQRLGQVLGRLRLPGSRRP